MSTPQLPRREFLKASALLAAATALDWSATPAAAAPSAADTGAARDYYELRAYRLRAGAPAEPLHAYFAGALRPELNARGIAAVGFFTEPDAKDGPAIWVLIAHPTIDSVARIATLDATLAAQEATAATRAAASKEHPLFERIDSWLLAAFAGQPQLELPSLTRENQPRVFELRTYESYNEAKAANKVAMFNDGEVEVMHQLGMMPVFFGQGLVGRDLPHLTYMLCSRDRAAAAQNWKAFDQHPVWRRLRDDPRYKDNVSKITSRFLTPTPYSQL